MSTTQQQLTVQPDQQSQEPTSDATGFVGVPDGTELSPYVQFFDAIERLEDDCVLFGTASLEARVSRVRVNRLREAAVAEWHKHHHAA
jgi:hypothetical protein